MTKQEKEINNAEFNLQRAVTDLNTAKYPDNHWYHSAEFWELYWIEQGGKKNYNQMMWCYEMAFDLPLETQIDNTDKENEKK